MSVLNSPDSPFGSTLDESTAVVTSKLVFADMLLSNLVKDYNFTEFARQVLIGILNAVRCEAGSLLEADYNEQSLHFRVAVGSRSDEVMKFKIPFGKGIAGHVFESRNPVIDNEMSKNEIAMHAIQKMIGFEPRTMAAFPIITRGKVFGVMEFLNRQEEGGFTPQDVELLSSLCSMAAQALEVRLMLNWVNQHDQKEAA